MLVDGCKPCSTCKVMLLRPIRGGGVLKTRKNWGYSSYWESHPGNPQGYFSASLKANDHAQMPGVQSFFDRGWYKQKFILVKKLG